MEAALSPEQLRNDLKATQILLGNIKAACKSLTRCGNLSTEEQTILDVLSAAMMSDRILELKLMSSVLRIVGLSRTQQYRGLELIQKRKKDSTNEEKTKLAIRIKRQPHSHGPKSKKSLDFIFNWFHNDCPLVEVDKSRKSSYKNYMVQCAGKKRKLTCQLHVLNGTKFEAAKSFLASDVYRNWQKQTGLEIPHKTVQSCICVCMKQATIHECCCPVCVEFKYLLKAWDTQRKVWHKEKKCECSGCNGPKRFAYKEASKSITNFQFVVCCPRKKYPHLTLPHLPGINLTCTCVLTITIFNSFQTRFLSFTASAAAKRTHRHHRMCLCAKIVDGAKSCSPATTASSARTELRSG